MLLICQFKNLYLNQLKNERNRKICLKLNDYRQKEMRYVPISAINES